MKILQFKKPLITFLNLLFWFVSFNFWYVILNPGVESPGVIQDLEVGWDWILLINSIFLIYCSLPFVWLAKRIKLWVKIIPSIVFVVPIGYVIIQAIRPDGNKDDVQVFLEYFVKNFLYVLVFHLTIVAAVYFNLKILISRYLDRIRFGHYLIYVSVLCLITAMLNFSVFDYVIDKLIPSLYYISYIRFWELILIVAAYLIITSVLFLIWQYILMLIAKREAIQNELSALKSQINPHFLFNNLNTIYSMASKKDERTAEVVLKLSDFLRYVLYDTSSETIPLEKEVEIIRNYVGLQEERVNPEITSIDLTIEGKFKGAVIEPLLLLPLAENCFKHGKGKDQSAIQIYIGFDGKQLIFKTENNIAIHEKADIEKNGGIGITNVEKRLQLIYPDQHTLEYGEKDGVFRLEMKIELNKRLE